MKRIILFIPVLLICAQAGAQLKLGLKLAPHVTWGSEDNKNTISNGARVNVSYGLMADHYFSDNYAFATEITVTTMGANLVLPASRYSKITYGGNTYTNSSDLTYNYHLQYINVPIMLRMRTKEIGYLRYYAEFGAGFGFLFRSKADVSFAGQTVSNVNINSPGDDAVGIQPVDYIDKVAAVRYSLIIGGGIQYNLFGNTLLVAGIRYDNALNSFTRDDRWSTSLNYIALTTGILF